MAYSHTSLSIESNLDIVGKYQELVEVTSNGDSLYIRAREVVNALKEDNLLTGQDEGAMIAQVVAQLLRLASIEQTKAW